jgi:hypothetical protein
MNSEMKEVGMEPRMVLLPNKILPCRIKATWDKYGENMGLNQILFKEGQIGSQVANVRNPINPFSCVVMEPMASWS